MASSQTGFTELVGYQVIETPSQSGSLTKCRVKSSAGDQYLAERLESESTSETLFEHVRRQWHQNSRSQPIGSLLQRELIDTGTRLTRVVDLPTGTPLQSQLFDRKFPLEEAIEIAHQITRCLIQWHQAGRVHGHISGDRIFTNAHNVGIELRETLGFEGQLRQDFQSMSAQDVMFFSPESSGSLSREISPASDLYAVGVALFTMLTARSPINADTASEYLDRQLCVEPPRLREVGHDVPPMLDDIVCRLLRRDPRNRYESASGLFFDLDKLRHDPDKCSLPTVIGTRDTRQTLAESSFVGRETEIRLIDRATADARDGKANALIITKADAASRRTVMDEISLRSRAKGMHVFRGGASVGSVKPLQSLESVLARVDAACEMDRDLASRIAKITRLHAATLSELVPSLSRLWTKKDYSAGPDQYGSRRAAVALETLFLAFSIEPEGVTFLFDDLDLADELTRSIVLALVDRTRKRSDQFRLCVVVTSESFERLELRYAGRQIELDAMDNQSLQLHLQSSTGPIEPEITQSIIEVADGNAAMASTILARMIDMGVVKASKKGWTATGPLSEALRGDESIAELLDRQIGNLPASAIDILSAAAVVGQRFELSLLAQVTEKPYASVLDIAADALGRRLLWHDPRAGWYRFAHDRIQTQLSERVSDATRKELHLRTAAYLEEHDAADVFALARHYDAAKRGDRALEKSLEAASKARNQYSLPIALEQLLIAKRWVREDDLETGLTISEGLGEIQLLDGRYDEAAKHLRDALEMARTPLQKARVQKQIGEVAFKRGRFSEAAQEYEHALAATGVHVPGNFLTMGCGLVAQSFFQVIHTYLPSSWIARQKRASEIETLRMHLLSRLSHVYWFSRHKLWTLSNHLRSLNEAERFAPSEILAAVYSEHGPVMSLLRWFGRANRYARRSFDIRKQLGNVWGQGQSLHYHSVVKLAECRFHDAIKTSTNAVELLRRMGDYWEMNMARYQTANAYYRVGRFEEAAEIASEMFYCGQEIGDIQATGISLDVWARTAPKTLPMQVVTEEAARSRPDAQSHAQTQLGFAVMLLHHDRLEEAIATLNSAIRRCEKAGHLNTYISPCYSWLGTALRRLAESTDCRQGSLLRRRIDAAGRALEKASRVARGFPADRAHCLRERALVALLRGDNRAAIGLLRRSIASAREHSQAKEELESLHVLQTMHESNVESIGSMTTEQLSRLEELHQDESVRGIAITDAKSTNLSLADRFVNVLQSGRRIAQSLSADAVFKEASEAARKLLRGQHVEVIAIRRDDDRVCLDPIQGEFESSSLTRVQANEETILGAIDSGSAVCLTKESGNKLGSAIASPIAFRGECVFVLLVTHEELDELFGDDELRIAEFVTTLAGAALENADGFLRLQQLNDTLEQRVQDRTHAAEDRARQLAVSNSQLRETEDQLREAIVHANSANEAKSRFLATISHEIRTPLNGILGMSRLARERSVDQRQSNYLDTVQESGRSLLSLINDLLDLSKLEAGKLELEKIAFDPIQMAGEISRLMAASAWQKGVELVCDVDPNLPAVIGDPSRLRQIVMNLMGNAIKFTDSGFISLKVRLEQTPTPTLVVRVRDSGIGIAADKCEKVFESFSQADSSTTRQYGGTGLGLAICRELSEMMDGTIAIESELGVGSEFIVRVPIDVDESASGDAFAVNGKRVVLIDSLEPSRDSLSAAFALAGADVVCLDDPDLLISALDDDPSIELIVLGQLIDEKLIEELSRRAIATLFLLPADAAGVTGGDRFRELRKPALSVEILEAAEAALRSEAISSLNADDQSAQDRQDDDVTSNMANGDRPVRILVAEDGEINREVIVGVLEMRGYEIVVAHDGEEAVQAVLRGQFDLCLMDVDMPNMDGLEATRQIRSGVAQSDLPVIAMTAHCGDQIWDKCRSAGMNAHLPKPLDPELLFETIDQFAVEIVSER